MAPLNKQGKFQNTLHQMKNSKSCYLMLLPFFLLFTIFTVIPVLMTLPIGFTNFNMVQMPKFIGLGNFYTLFVEDEIFLLAIKNTLIFAVFTGPFSYFLSFILAWLINEMRAGWKTFFTFVFYAPAMAPNAFVIFTLIFSGDTYGYANSFLMKWGIINTPIQWFTDVKYLMGVIVIVQLWISMGAGFLAMRAGFQGIDKAMYEAGAVEGIKNRFQELIYITVPSMGPQLMFAAVLQITASFTVGNVSAALVGVPSTGYVVHSIMNHASDYSGIRYEMGYASAICFLLFTVMIVCESLVRKVLNKFTD